MVNDRDKHASMLSSVSHPLVDFLPQVQELNAGNLVKATKTETVHIEAGVDIYDLWPKGKWFPHTNVFVTHTG
jgi:hypothetical protein